MDDPQFQWSLHGDPPSLLRLRGELDSANAPHHLAELLTAIDGHDIEIDASELSFVDSSGLRLLLTLANDNGGAIGFRAVHPALRRVVEITDLDHTLRLPPH